MTGPRAVRLALVVALPATACSSGGTGIEVLPIDHETFRYYRLVP